MEHVVTGTRFGFHDGMFTGRSQAAAHLFMSPRNSSTRSWWFRHHSPFQLIVLPISIHQPFISFHISRLRHSGNVNLAIKQQLEALASVPLASHSSSWHQQLRKVISVSFSTVLGGEGYWLPHWKIGVSSCYHSRQHASTTSESYLYRFRIGSNVAAYMTTLAQAEHYNRQRHLGCAIELLDQGRSILWSQTKRDSDGETRKTCRG